MQKLCSLTHFLNIDRKFKRNNQKDELFIDLMENREIISRESNRICKARNRKLCFRVSRCKDFNPFSRCNYCREEFYLFKDTFFAPISENGNIKVRLPAQRILKLIFYYFQQQTQKVFIGTDWNKVVYTITIWCNQIRMVIHQNWTSEKIGPRSY